MRANTQYIGNNSKQNAEFPLEMMYLTQGEDGQSTHQGTLAMDFIGYASGVRIYQCPYYAPCDLELVATPDISNHIYVYTSTDTVNFIDGTSDYLTIMFNHDNDVYTIGRTVSQGSLLGHTGTFGNGISGGVSDHVHIEAKKGNWEGLIQNTQGVWCMKNADHLYNLLGINDTTIYVDGGYNWREFAPTPTPSVSRSRFPWALYARKLREKRSQT